MFYVRIYCNDIKVRTYGNTKRDVLDLLNYYNSRDSHDKRLKYLLNQIPNTFKNDFTGFYNSNTYEFSYEMIKVPRHSKKKKLVEKGKLNLIVSVEFVWQYYTIKLIDASRDKCLYDTIIYPIFGYMTRDNNILLY